MHEFSMVSAVVETVLEFVEARRIKKVLQVRLAVGELTSLEPEQLRFGYQAIVKRTPINGSTLEIEKVAAEVNCPHCRYQGRPKYWDDASLQEPVPTLQCPACGKAAEAARGHECEIRKIKYVT